MDALDDVRYVNKSRRSRQVGFGVLAVLVLVTMLGLASVAWTVYFQPPPAKYLRAEMLTPQVTPTGRTAVSRSGGNVRMRAWVLSSMDYSCLVGTQYYIIFSDQTMANVPGMRLTTPGRVKQSIYDASVPVGAPTGPAQFYVRDSFSCTAQIRRVESPRADFIIGGPGGGDFAN